MIQLGHLLGTNKINSQPECVDGIVSPWLATDLSPGHCFDMHLLDVPVVDGLSVGGWC